MYTNTLQFAGNTLQTVLSLPPYCYLNIQDHLITLVHYWWRKGNFFFFSKLKKEKNAGLDNPYWLLEKLFANNLTASVMLQFSEI